MKLEDAGINLLIFWAKTPQGKEKDKSPDAYHPLLCHLIDVAVVTHLMWQKVLSKAAKEQIAKALALQTDEAGLELAGKIVAWIAGLHDLGKASPPFALRDSAVYLSDLYEKLDSRFSRAHFHYPVPDAVKAPHGYVTAKILPELLSRVCGFPPGLAYQTGILLGGHHGIFPRSPDLNHLRASNQVGTPAWSDVRLALTRRLAELLSLRLPIEFQSNPQLDHSMVMFLAGLVSVADWIGSNSFYFKFAVEDFHSLPNLNWEGYFRKASDRAREALQEQGWLGWARAPGEREFFDLFPELKKYPLRTVQETAIQITDQLTAVGIVIIEAPMGEGKTEAAMFLADHFNSRLDQNGIYFALPTQATSNQMYLRARRFLQTRFEEKMVLLQLLHGHAALSAEFETQLREGREALRLTQVFQEDSCCDHHRSGNVIAAEWFTHRKRGLLAPYGVGTVDQALMAVLQTRHVFVRLFGLAHKTVIIDEVHAYDAYMSTLLERLLEWLAALSSPVILLSATLPKARRKKLLDAYARGLGKKESEAGHRPDQISYPLITWETEKASGIQPIEVRSTRTLSLRWLNGGLESGDFEIGEILTQHLTQGGCAAVICNTVDRAQAVYDKLAALFPGWADDGAAQVDLLHARFLFKDRAKREFRALIRFGKDGEKLKDPQGVEHPVKRPDCAILVSTQIIEQSLDLDFDIIITDLAPVDLLLQRAGREWRHERKERGGITAPVLYICRPEKVENDVPEFGQHGLIYSPHILLRTWLELKDCLAFSIPTGVENLIEAVYDEDRECPSTASQKLKDRWKETKDTMIREKENKSQNAKGYSLLPPYEPDILEDRNFDLEEDSPDYHRKRQAATRDDDTPSISVVFLKPDELRLLKPEPDIATVRQLLQRSVNIVKRGAVNDLIVTEAPSEWQQSAYLRHHRLICIDAKGRKQVGDWIYILDIHKGVIIKTVKQESANSLKEEELNA